VRAKLNAKTIAGNTVTTKRKVAEDISNAEEEWGKRRKANNYGNKELARKRLFLPPNRTPSNSVNR